MSHSASEELDPVGPDNPGYDTSDPNTAGLTVFIVMFVATLLLVILATAVYFNFVKENQEEEAVMGKPSEDLAALHAREGEQTKTYGYIDKEKGVVQIPLSRAMELVVREAAEGKPKYPTVAVMVKKEEPAGAPGAAPVSAPSPAPAAVPQEQK